MSDSRPWEDVRDDNYFRMVQKNMVESGLGRKEEVRVRFGRTGEGYAPHYQLEANGQFRRFNGLSHRLYADEPLRSFDEGHISDEIFDYDGVVELRKDCRALTAR